MPAPTFALDPSGNALVVSSSLAKGKQRGGQLEYSRYDALPESRRTLVVDSYALHSGLEALFAAHAEAAEAMDAVEDSFAWTKTRKTALRPSGPDASLLADLSRIGGLYISRLGDHEAALLSDRDHVNVAEVRHTRSLMRLFALANIVFLPSDGRGDSLIGEELLEWLNKHDVRPTTHEIAAVSNLAEPYEHGDFWTVLEAAVLRGIDAVAVPLLDSLTHHKAPATRERAIRVRDLVQRRPRSNATGPRAHATTAHFLAAVRTWRAAVTRERTDVADLMRNGEEEDWAESILRILDILLGDRELIVELAVSWQEALAAWCTLLAPACTREDLPAAVEQVLEAVGPPDTTETEARIEVALLSGRVSEALVAMTDLDLWLAVHVCDLLDRAGALEDEPVRDDGRPRIRDHLMMRYCDHLRSDPGLWRIVLDLLSSCGDLARPTMSQVVRFAPFLPEAANSADDDDDDLQVDADKAPVAPIVDRVSTIADVLLQCKFHGLEADGRAVCRMFAEHLMRERRFGEAVSYALRANDVRRIARIADRLLSEYVEHGALEFARLVDQIPTSVLHPDHASLRPELFAGGVDDDDEDDERDDAASAAARALSAADRAVFASRLAFLARYRDFHALYASGARLEAARLLVQLLTSLIAPRPFWPVLLLDAVPLLEDPAALFTAHETHELLRCLEEVVPPQGAPDSADLLGPLGLIVTRHNLPPPAAQASPAAKAAWRLASAQKQVVVVRRALARHLARCFSASL